MHGEDIGAAVCMAEQATCPLSRRKLTTGGGIFNNEGTLAVSNSTFSGNSAEDGAGGGIFNSPFSTATVTNSTFSGNSADNGGGSINNSPDATLTVTSSTFSENSASQGGGISNAGTATLKNTIMAKSPSGGNCFNSEGTITDGGYNIDDGTTCGFSQANNSLLDPDGLQNNGGPTQTIALLKDSPARNAIPKGTNGCGTEIKEDQRGKRRPQGKGCDTGAYERG